MRHLAQIVVFYAVSHNQKGNEHAVEHWCEREDTFPSCAAAATASSVSFVYSYMDHGVTSNRFPFFKVNLAGLNAVFFPIKTVETRCCTRRNLARVRERRMYVWFLLHTI